MEENIKNMKPIAYIRTDFPEKFGVPRQSGLVEELQAEIVFLPEYRVKEAFRGLEEYSHIWLIWIFSQNKTRKWSPTVRPPRLGGNVRKGVFATRSPFRPNPVGLSCVRLEKIRWTEEEGPVLSVRGADLVDGTPILDLKPYLPYVDSHPEASGSFSDEKKEYALNVEFPEHLKCRIPGFKLEALTGILKNDPRPAYQNDPERIYGFTFAGYEIRFFVKDQTAIVCEVIPPVSLQES